MESGGHTVEHLRAQLAEYQSALQRALPRLRNLERLEQLASDAGTTPEAMAQRAAIEVLRRERASAEAERAASVTECEQLKGEMAMLNETKAKIGTDVIELRGEYDSLAIEVTDIVEQLTEMRMDARRLLEARNRLATEVAILQERLQELSGQPLPDAPAERRHAPVADTPVSDEDDPVTTRSNCTSLSADDQTEQLEAEAFDAFFHAEFDHDKSRDWMLR